MKEKRNQKRVKVNWKIRLSVNGRKVGGLVENISLEGLLVYCEDPIPLNEKISITIFPTNCKAINVKGKPMWSNFYGLDLSKERVPVCIGVSFIEIAMKDRHILKTIIEF